MGGFHKKVALSIAAANAIEELEQKRAKLKAKLKKVETKIKEVKNGNL